MKGRNFAALMASACLSVWATGALAEQAGATRESMAGQSENTAGAGETGGLPDIVVTAQKRSERINDVPMSITATSGEDLVARGVREPGDLAKIVPGFQFSSGFLQTPVYTLRGIGFYDNSLGSKPSVAVYVDEVPLPFSSMGSGVSLDLERVEVLKGPQGTLFGQNATGGAINYIAAKPTDSLRYGLDASFGRFNQGDIGGFVSGPISDTLSVRVAAQQTFGDGWQRSYTRDDRLGKRDKLSGRLTLNWTPAPELRVAFTASGWRDKSEMTAPQFLSPSKMLNIDPAIINYPRPPRSNLYADWTPGLDYQQDSNFYQLALRVEYDITSDITVTSLTSYGKAKIHHPIDTDGVDLQNIYFVVDGTLDSVSQEVRLAGSLGDRMKWVVGANYARDSADEQNVFFFPQSTVTHTFDFVGIGPFAISHTFNDQQFKTASAFGNLDYTITDTITAHAGVRYTDSRGRGESCTRDDGSGLIYAPAISLLYSGIRSGLGLGPVTVAPGGCITAINENFEPGLVRGTLNQDNLSWRGGLDWKPSSTTLVYANITKGYKSGSFPLVAALVAKQLAPATQESVLAYETGFKLSLLNRRVQINGAAFYYDYRDKQFKGRTLAQPNIFGSLETLLNVPKARVLGAELQVDLAPVAGLRAGGGITYLSTRVGNGYSNYTDFSDIVDFSGEPFPFTPKWQMSGDAEYEFALSDGLNAFAGIAGRYQTKTNSGFGQLPILQNKAYATLDVRAGIAGRDDSWRLTAWVRNATNTYYWNSVANNLDTVIRLTGDPRTFGISLTVRGGN